MLYLTLLSGLFSIGFMYGAWKNFKLANEPETFDPVWFYPIQIPPPPTSIVKDKISVIIKLPNDTIVDYKTISPVVVRASISLGFLFFYFLKVQHEYGLLAADDLAKEKSGWKFYSMSKSGKRKYLLNPALTVRNNGIKDNGIIEAVQIGKDELKQ